MLDCPFVMYNFNFDNKCFHLIQVMAYTRQSCRAKYQQIQKNNNNKGNIIANK